MNSSSFISTTYMSEVLGIKNYLCPESVYALRTLKGGLPCRVLAVVFKPLSPAQSIMLKKIMASIEVLEYSVLEIKNSQILNQLLYNMESLTNGVCFFGGPNLVDKGLLIEKDQGLIQPATQASTKNKVEPVVTSDHLEQTTSISFLQVVDLEELEGDSQEVKTKKNKLWTQLKQWKNRSGI